MIIEQTQISKTLIIFLEVESLKTGHELENDFEEFQELVNSAGAEIVDKSISKQNKPSISHFINKGKLEEIKNCLLYTSPSPRDRSLSRMPSSA